MKTAAVIPAAGAGVRMGQGRAKQFLDFRGRPMLAATLEVFQHCPSIDAVILVVPPENVEECRRSIVEAWGLTKVKKVVEGGRRRQDSVRRGIRATGGEFERILIHDGVRPLVRPVLIERIVAEGTHERAVITALPAKETVKAVTEEGFVEKTYDRRRIWLVQTPQIFKYEDILEAHNRALREGWEDITDDALLMERMGIPVKVIEGSEENIKVTTPHDMALAQYLWRKDESADRHKRK
ncbi:MAG: 2-C-methyl-D-erythritol 4-phosphate cytidylyltransferase [Pseudomonadota bacterium]